MLDNAHIRLTLTRGKKVHDLLPFSFTCLEQICFNYLKDKHCSDGKLMVKYMQEHNNFIIYLLSTLNEINPSFRITH